VYLVALLPVRHRQLPASSAKNGAVAQSTNANAIVNHIANQSPLRKPFNSSPLA
jgi:hypothetical protein